MGKEFQPFQNAFIAYLGKVDSGYSPDVPYHGAAHAADVMSTAFWFLKSEFMHQGTTHLDRFMVMVACAIHDIGHTGFNNPWYVKTHDPLALRYNDKSCLENMHVAKGFEIMREFPKCNWFAQMVTTGGSVNAQLYVRK